MTANSEWPKSEAPEVSEAPEQSEAPETGRRGPQRRCIASGQVCDKADLVRFVVGPDGAIVPDPGEDLPGRGLWLRPGADMIETARRRRLFARAARAPVTVPDDLGDRVAGLLRRRCLARLGLARAAGDAATGFDKVRALLQRDAAGVLLQAADAAPDGRDKLRRLAAARRPDLPILDWFGSEELGRALGRDRAVHAAVRDGGHARRLLREARRLAGFAGPLATARQHLEQPADPADRGATSGDETPGAAIPGNGSAAGAGNGPNPGPGGNDVPDGPDPHRDERIQRAPERHDDE
jgi:hypothetical protein